MGSTLYFLLALAALVAGRPSNMSSEQGESEGTIDLSRLLLDDMKLLPEQLEQVKSSGISDSQYLWPNRTIPYVIHPSLDNFDRLRIMDAMFDYRRFTCVRFVPRTTQKNFIVIFKGQGCYSNVGMTNRGPQPLSLGQGCTMFRGVILHELGHATGLIHEHERYDRDDFLEIKWGNIMPGMESQFNKYPEEKIRNLTPYSFGSIMHYGSSAFSKDAKGGAYTIVKKNGGTLKEVQEKSALTYDDRVVINRMYGCEKPTN